MAPRSLGFHLAWSAGAFAIIVVGGDARSLRAERLAATGRSEGSIGHSLTSCDIKSNI